MRYPKAHADSSGSVPFALRGSKSLRTILSTAVAAAIGFAPALAVSTPAMAALNDLTFTTVSPTAAEGGVITINYKYVGAGGTYTVATTPGTPNGATAGSDYTAPSTSLVLANGSVTPVLGSITIQTTDDALYEPSETIAVTASYSTASDTQTIDATITDNDTAPSYTLTAAPNPVTEGANAKTTITAKLSAASGMDTSIALSTANGTAIAGSAPNGDYTALSASTVTIPAGSLTGTRDILITNDGVKDQADTETFTVNGTGTNVAPTTATTSVSIVDAQTTPKLSLSGGGSGTEGGSTTFTVTADTASELPMTVQWNSVDATPAAGHGTATAGEDFSYPGTRTVTIPAGSTSATFSVSLTADQSDELDEDYALQLSNPTNAVLGATTKVAGTITDNDAAPTLTITPASVAEGDSGRKWQTFTATLSAKSGKTVKADWTTGTTGPGLGNAVPGKDFVTNGGTLSFAPGTTTQSFAVEIIGDTIDEGPSSRMSAVAGGETFRVYTSAVSGEVTPSLSSSGPADITITDDDNAPTWSFADTSMKEGNADHVVLMPIKLIGSSDRAIKFDVTDLGTGSAESTIGQDIGDNDYAQLNTTLTIAPEMSTGYAAVLVNGDLMHESDETINLSAAPDSSPVTDGSAWLASATADPASITLTNDDDAPDLEINSVVGKEGETVNVTGTVTGTSDEFTTLTISFTGASVKGSKAADNTDFTNPGAKVMWIPAGTVSGAILPVQTLSLLQDNSPEPAETIVGSGVGLGNIGTVTDGVVTIAANDGSTPGGPGQAPKPTIKAPVKVVGPSTVPVEGTVAPLTEVQLWAGTVAGNAPLKPVKTMTSDKDGYYFFEQDITWGTNFAVRSQNVKSDDVTVWVQQEPLFVSSTTTRGQITFGIKGSPTAAGQSAAVQQWINGAWTNIRAGKTGADGVYRVTVKWPMGSKPTVRGLVAGEAAKGTQTGASAQQTPTVR